MLKHMSNNPKELIRDLLSNNQGIAFGEDHKSPEIFAFAKSKASDLRANGVKTLYIEAILSADTQAVQKMLKDSDDKGLRDYLDSRSWSNNLATQYFDVIKEYHKQGIEVVGIDVKTDDRFRVGNQYWQTTITDHQKTTEGKYIVFGGASHFGNTFGPGVNVKLGIPSIDFQISDNSDVTPTVRPSEEKFQGRSVADYEITLPKKKDDAAPAKAPIKLEGIKPEDIEFLKRMSPAGASKTLSIPAKTSDIEVIR